MDDLYVVNENKSGSCRGKIVKCSGEGMNFLCKEEDLQDIGYESRPYNLAWYWNQCKDSQYSVKKLVRYEETSS